MQKVRHYETPEDEYVGLDGEESAAPRGHGPSVTK
jgi:hypothetical protein